MQLWSAALKTTMCIYCESLGRTDEVFVSGNDKPLIWLQYVYAKKFVRLFNNINITGNPKPKGQRCDLGS